MQARTRNSISLGRTRKAVGRRVGKLLRNPPFAARGRRCVEKGGGLRKGLPTLQPKLLFLGDALVLQSQITWHDFCLSCVRFPLCSEARLNRTAPSVDALIDPRDECVLSFRLAR